MTTVLPLVVFHMLLSWRKSNYSGAFSEVNFWHVWILLLVLIVSSYREITLFPCIWQLPSRFMPS